MSYKLILPILFISGCCSTPPAPIPPPQIIETVRYEKIPVPEQCLAPCDGVIDVIITNRDLLVAYNNLKTVNTCWRARQQCVIDSQTTLPKNDSIEH